MEKYNYSFEHACIHIKCNYRHILVVPGQQLFTNDFDFVMSLFST